MQEYHLASRNPDIDELGKNKARLILMNKSDLSDAGRNREWSDFLRRRVIMLYVWMQGARQE